MKAITESQLWKKRLGDWVVNPYIGCEHGCKHCYCPAMPGVKFFNDGHSQEEWGEYIKPKDGIVEALRQQLRTFTPDKAKRTDWGDGWVLMSFLTDCYTPLEAELRITRQCLELLLEAGHKVRLQTRSALVERDFDLLAKHKDRVLIGTSLPYLNDDLARTLEPRATGPTRRIKMLHRAEAQGLDTYAAIAPFMPWDDEDRLEEIIAHLSVLENTREIFCEVLNPKGVNLKMMREAVGKAGWILPASALRFYDEERWAEFTYVIAKFGHARCDQFIPWPDTGRAWKRHLKPEQRMFLESFLPPLDGGGTN